MKTPCIVCGEMTNCIEILSTYPICSIKCRERWFEFLKEEYGATPNERAVELLEADKNGGKYED